MSSTSADGAKGNRSSPGSRGRRPIGVSIGSPRASNVWWQENSEWNGGNTIAQSSGFSTRGGAMERGAIEARAGQQHNRSQGMGMRKKGAERASMETLEPQDVASFGEDPELLDPAEEAALAGGNAGEPGPRQIQEPARSAQVQEPAAGRTEPESVEEEGASREQSGGETWSDEQVRKMAPNDSVPAWSLVKERQENRALKRNLEELTRKLTEHEEKWNRANERLRQLQERAEKAENTRP